MRVELTLSLGVYPVIIAEAEYEAHRRQNKACLEPVPEFTGELRREVLAHREAATKPAIVGPVLRVLLAFFVPVLLGFLLFPLYVGFMSQFSLAR